MQRMAKAGREINTSTLIEALIDANLLSSVGSRPYVFSLTEGVPRTRNMAPFVDAVREKWKKRQLVKICQSYASRASEGGEAVAELIAAADRDLLCVAADDQSEWPSVELQTHQEMALMADQRSGRKVMGYRYGIPHSTVW